MTREQKAVIARRNGAKSKGPVTPEGKLRSSRNALVTGRHATTLKFFVPPAEAIADRHARRRYYPILDGMLDSFRPENEHEAFLVREMAHIRWHLEPLCLRRFQLSELEYKRVCIDKDRAGESVIDMSLYKRIDTLTRRESHLLNMLLNDKKLRRTAA